MKTRVPVCLCLASLLLTLPLGAQEKKDESKTVAQAQPLTDLSVRKSATDDPNYVLGALDVVDISVWKEPELSRTLPIRPDGKISLPLLNDVQAAGLTPSQLASKITTSLEKYVTDPQVTVIVTQTNSQRIFILGEVARAGAYALLPNMTVLQALANAGGLTPFASQKKIYVLRSVNGTQEKLKFNYKDVINGKNTDENIELKPGDQIVVP